jgi:SAM-dependent methyltransferase
MQKWKRKAWLHRLIARFPMRVTYPFSYFVQRRFGSLRRVNPTTQLSAGVKILDSIRQHGKEIEGKTFLEIGTGRRLNVPMALWLCGASRITTVDLNRYLRAELVFDDIAYLRRHRQEIFALFGDFAREPAFQKRFSHLLQCREDLDSLLEMLHVEYLAPANGVHLQIEPESIDYHVSRTVLEHVPPGVVERILSEGKRVLRRDGLLVHFVDFSDHFAHSDRSIPLIHFLRFSDREWSRLSGDLYMYHNRLRIDDFIELFRRVGLRVLSVDANVDPRSLRALRQGFLVDARFRSKSDETNATADAWIVAAPE